MKSLQLILLFLFSATNFAQVEVDLLEVINTPRDSIVSCDSFDFFYALNGKSLKKENRYVTFNFSNLSFGKVSSINTFNPIKTYVFYKDTNSLVVLDNRLSELALVNFNQLPELKIVTHSSPANKNFVWLFNQSNMKLELFDFITLETTFKTNPITSPIIDMTSDYNYVWLLTEKELMCFNYRGSLIYKLKNTGYTKIKNLDENLILQKDNNLFFYHKKKKEIEPIDIPKQLINSFFVSQQNLYIYGLKKINKYQINF